MADRGISFAGDVGDGALFDGKTDGDFGSASMSAADMAGSPESNPGMNVGQGTIDKPENWLDTPPTGAGEVSFVGDVGLKQG